MANAREIYFHALQQEFGLGKDYHPTWPVGVDVQVGAVGQTEAGLFVQRSDLRTKGIDWEASTSPAHLKTLDFQSSTGVDVAIKAAGETNKAFSSVAKVDAGIKFAFSKAGATVVSFREVNEERISDEDAIESRIIAAFDESKLDYGDEIITHVMRAQWALILVSGTSNASVEFKANADIDAANLGGNLAWRHYSNMAIKTFSDGGFTVAYRSRTLEGRWPRTGPKWDLVERDLASVEEAVS